MSSVVHMQRSFVHTYYDDTSPMAKSYTTTGANPELILTTLILDGYESVTQYPPNPQTYNLAASPHHNAIVPWWFWIGPAETWRDADPADRVLALLITNKMTLIFYMGTRAYVEGGLENARSMVELWLQPRLAQQEV